VLDVRHRQPRRLLHGVAGLAQRTADLVPGPAAPVGAVDQDERRHRASPDPTGSSRAAISQPAAPLHGAMTRHRKVARASYRSIRRGIDAVSR
jgi:hypothetical protein